MSFQALLSGTLAADPVERAGENGKTFATASLRVTSEEAEAFFASLIAFGDVAPLLLTHRKGDALAVAGRGQLRAWTARDGTERHGLSVVAEAILTPYQVRTRRANVAAATRETEAAT